MTIKVALIPPLGWEKYFADSTGVQMALAVEACMAHPTYVNTLKDCALVDDDYVIVDNGEAEGVRSNNRTVTDFALMLHAKEIVLPDVMGDRHGTITKVSSFFNQKGNYWPKMNYMAVAQGDERDARVIVHYFAEFKYREQFGALDTNPITTIGIPRHLCTVTSNPSARIDLANWIGKEYGDRFQIHFLGANSVWPQEIKFANKYTENVRSIDTSLPFNYALAGKLLERDDPEAMTRDRLYLSGRLPRLNLRHVVRNIEVYKSWAA